MGHIGSQGKGRRHIGQSLLHRTARPGPAYCSPVNRKWGRVSERWLARSMCFAVEPGHLSVIPRVHVVEGEKQPLKIIFFPLRSMACTHLCTHQVSIFKNFNEVGSGRRFGLPPGTVFSPGCAVSPDRPCSSLVLKCEVYFTVQSVSNH